MSDDFASPDLIRDLIRSDQTRVHRVYFVDFRVFRLARQLLTLPLSTENHSSSRQTSKKTFDTLQWDVIDVVLESLGTDPTFLHSDTILPPVSYLLIPHQRLPHDNHQI